MYSKEKAIEIRKEFWTEFNNYCLKFYGKKHSWILYNTGIKDINLKFDCNRENAKVIFAFEFSTEKAVEIFSYFKTLQESYAMYIDNNWIWKEKFILDSGKEICALYKQYDNVNIYNTDDWKKTFKFFAFEMKKLEKIFLAVKDNLKEYVKK
ncbi:MAG: DUF4268 domain-containing protein [Bacteroidales bacterium]|jgi:hypothetical protein|nr:DUF4268 domain-containing protein [Bacteroidales bacterium]